MAAADFAHGVALGLAVLFGFAAAHKLRVTLGRTPAAGRQGILQRRVLGLPSRLSAPVLAAAEVTIAGGLLMTPQWGLWAAAAVLVAYSFGLRTMAAGEPCHCFSASSSARASIALWRNVALVAAAIPAAAILAVESPTHLDAAGGVAAVVLACVLAVEALEELRARTNPHLPTWREVERD